MTVNVTKIYTASRTADARVSLQLLAILELLEQGECPLSHIPKFVPGSALQMKNRLRRIVRVNEWKDKEAIISLREMSDKEMEDHRLPIRKEGPSRLMVSITPTGQRQLDAYRKAIGLCLTE